MVSFLGASESTLIAAGCGFVAGVACPGVIRKIRAFLFGVEKKAETLAADVKKMESSE